MIKVSITDDHDLFRSGIAMLLEKSNTIEVVHQTASVEELLNKLDESEVDICLLDISMNETNGLEALLLLRKSHPSIRSIVLTMHNEGQYVVQAIRNGAYGYLLKDCGPEELTEAIEQVFNGKKYFNKDVSHLMIEAVNIESNTQKISKREKEVLKLVAQGLTTKEIADQLFVSKRTIETHRSNILKKLDVQNTAELITKATQLGLL
ncbi:response regulator transcription factor [Carboxylicivirga linearis]|uniref:Response regulator transcription factor n=1 Tax=Carboxylicivirga linearis TaxID=1628157 RepID=A0ABS5JT92_9BACT|nr:response regulator transcription factor [Carboxylicivirga linearis]MBS2098067.1 response regulator transcription factor [Carboxylicivirga linearis]